VKIQRLWKQALIDLWIFKKDFIGKDILLEQREQGLNKKLVSFISDTRRSPRHDDKIIAEKKE